MEGGDSVAWCGRRGDLGGHEGKALGGRRRLEGGGYSAGAHCSALQSVQMAGMPFFWQSGHGQACLVALGRSKNVGKALDALGGHWSEEGGEEEGCKGCPER